MLEIKDIMFVSCLLLEKYIIITYKDQRGNVQLIDQISYFLLPQSCKFPTSYKTYKKLTTRPYRYIVI